MAISKSAEGLRTYPIRNMRTEGIGTDSPVTLGLEETFLTSATMAKLIEIAAKDLKVDISIIPSGEKRKYPCEVPLVPEHEAEITLFDSSTRKLKSDKLDEVMENALALARSVIY